MIHSAYLNVNFDPKSLKLKVKTCLTELRPRWKAAEFEAIAVSGNSGTLFGSIIAYTLKCPLILVRKPNDDSHTLTLVEGSDEPKTYIIIDDLVASGKTLRRIQESITRDPKFMHAKYIGHYLYRYDEWHSAD